MDKIHIKTDSGELVEAQAPIIISASRSTDIPAFYAQWFINRLRAGYVVWYNPFNRSKVYVSFAKCKVVVFWTKNPKPLIPLLEELDKRGIHYYFQFTLNDYIEEGFEPGVPKLEERVETFKKLSSLIGKEKVIWRFDPLIMTSQQTVRGLLKKIWHVGNQIKGYTDKLVFSFVDVKDYKKVQSNFVKETNYYTKEDVLSAEWSKEKMEEMAEGIAKLRDVWKEQGWPITLATCAESVELERFGIEHNRCIDGELMKEIFKEDEDLVYYLKYGEMPPENSLFPPSLDRPALSAKKMKDKGQRKLCGCMVSKDIGMYNTCRHLCVYCYANTSKELVLKNKEKHNDNSESIIE